MMKKAHLLPNVVTAFSLTCGLFVIFKMNMTLPGSANHELIMQMALILLLAAVADTLDGLLARALKTESQFGGFFDSMADAVTFGVAPSIVVLKTLSLEPGTTLSFWVTSGAMMYSVCGVLRLVRFNVAKAAAEANEKAAAAQSRAFTGLPIPGAAACLISANLFLVSEDCPDILTFSESGRGVVLSLAMCLLGYFMICQFKFPSVKALNIRVTNYGLVFATVLFAVVIFYGVLHHFSWVFAALAWLYVLSALALNLARKVAGKKSSALKDFEPEDDF